MSTASSTEHPVAHLETSLVVLRRRATLAVIGLAAVMLARGSDVAARAWSIPLIREIPADGAGEELMASLRRADAFVDGAGVAITMSFVVSAVLFLRWLHRLLLLARGLDADVKYTPAEAVWAWFIPLVSLIRPYQVVANAHAALAPEKVAAPAPRVDPTAATDYRSVAFIEPSPAMKLPPALIGLWWGMFVVMSVTSQIVSMASSRTDMTIESTLNAYNGLIFVSGAAVCAAGLAITVVRGLTARAAERYRRMRETTPELLEEQGIELDSVPMWARRS